MRSLIGSIAAILTLAAAWAEGPGTRIRTTPEIPQAMELSHPPAPVNEAKPCDGLRGEARERCLRQPREADAERRSGPGSGATSGNASGTAGGASFGGTAPR